MASSLVAELVQVRGGALVQEMPVVSLPVLDKRVAKG
jgi:hypothetical protein